MASRTSVLLVGAAVISVVAWMLSRQAAEQAPTVGPLSVEKTSLPAPTPVPPQLVSPVVQSGVNPSPPPSRATTTAVGPPPSNSVPLPMAVLPGPGADFVARTREKIDTISLMLRDYRTVIGDNPVGSNAEIMGAITGGNPRKARLGPPEGQELNEKGELVDEWGTPYFFHQMSATHMDITSAGPDRKLNTADDIKGR